MKTFANKVRNFVQVPSKTGRYTHVPHGVKQKRQQVAVRGIIALNVAGGTKGALPPTRVPRALRYNKHYYDPRSIRIIENVVNAVIDGKFGSNDAQAVYSYQRGKTGLCADGMVGENTLNVMVPELAKIRGHAQAIHLVTDFYNAHLKEVLSIRYDAGIYATRTRFESGYLPVITIGPRAFQSAVALLNAISNALSISAPGHLPASVQGRLSPVQVQASIRVNRRYMQDIRSILAIQELVQAQVTGVIDTDTVQSIAEFQVNRGLTRQPNGRIDSRRSFQVMVSELTVRRHYNSVIRLIIDYFSLSTHGALLDISADTRSRVQRGWIPGTTAVRVGHAWFRRSFATLVHQIAHLLDLVRSRKAGITNRATRVFLGEALEILSIGTPEEGLSDFMRDAQRALRYWNRMGRQEQRKYWVKFHRVRAKLWQRYTAASPAQQRTYSRLVSRYFSVLRP